VELSENITSMPTVVKNSKYVRISTMSPAHRVSVASPACRRIRTEVVAKVGARIDKHVYNGSHHALAH
jgi:hypothetical protein